MTYPPPPGSDGTYPPPPDPPVQAYQPPEAYQPPNPYQPVQPYAPPSGYDYSVPNYQAPQSYDKGFAGSPYAPYPGSPYAPPRPPTEGLAIASLVVSCAAVLGLCGYGLGAVLGIVGAILGHVARRRIRANGTGGAGMALAGIIVGWIVTALGIIGITVLIVALVTSGSTSSGSTF